MKLIRFNYTQKSPTKLNAAKNKFDTGDLFINGKNHRDKTSLSEFKVTTPENSLISKQAVTSKRNPNIQYQPIVEPLPQYLIGLVL